MSHSNPGYDIEVGVPPAIERYIEVKGTIGPDVHFYLSEGERLFSEARAAAYTLAVVVDVDLVTKTGHIVWFDGPIDTRFALKPISWEGHAHDRPDP